MYSTVQAANASFTALDCFPKHRVQVKSGDGGYSGIACRVLRSRSAPLLWQPTRCSIGEDTSTAHLRIVFKVALKMVQEVRQGLEFFWVPCGIAVPRDLDSAVIISLSQGHNGRAIGPSPGSLQ